LKSDALEGDSGVSCVEPVDMFGKDFDAVASIVSDILGGRGDV
jgi:hypothetical protein